jgi:23S rRNA pseudouridine1911/1915/1917 synthase
LAAGIPPADHFDINAPIGPVSHSKIETVHAACPGGKRAFSRVRVLERRDKDSLMEVSIETGRPHQIRIHLAFAGYPLVGDPLYATGGGIKNPQALPGDPGYLLHAESLSFCHPATGLQCKISCPPPPELRETSEA